MVRARGPARLATAAVVAAVALSLAACGDDDGEAGAAASTTSTEAEATETTEGDSRYPPPAEGTSIADVLRTDERFSRFAEFVGNTQSRIPGRPSWLDVWDWTGDQIGDNRDGVTVFAPTDAAFDAADPALLERLERDDSETNALRYSLLSEHYVHYLFPSDDFTEGPQRAWRGMVEMGLDPLTWGGHPIVETDIEASNGWIHAVDGIIVPDVVQRAVDEG